MFLQSAMIERVRTLCQQDERLVAACMFGSFARGEGDEFSDIEFALFFADEALPAVDAAQWVAQIAPVALFFADDVGHQTAIFRNLVRGEFHFKPAAAIPTVETWRGNAWFPTVAAARIVDRTGVLTHHLQPLIGPPPRRDTPDMAQSLTNNFINWFLFGTNVLARGEAARALALLSITHRYLLWMARLLEGATAQWPTPAKNVEQALSATAYARYQRCTATLERALLVSAYRETWLWGQEMLLALLARHTLTPPTVLLEQITARLAQRLFV